MAKGTYRLDVDKVMSFAFRKGWSESKLLQEAGLSKQIIYRARKGGTSYPNTIHIIAMTLGVEPEDITKE